MQRAVGYALYRAQEGKKAPDTKPLRGLARGGRVLEILEDHDTDAYRVVYTAQFARAVYVLHAFQKKSRKGRATPRHEIELIRRRYEAAREHYEAEVRDR